MSRTALKLVLDSDETEGAEFDLSGGYYGFFSNSDVPASTKVQYLLPNLDTTVTGNWADTAISFSGAALTMGMLPRGTYRIKATSAAGLVWMGPAGGK